MADVRKKNVDQNLWDPSSFNYLYPFPIVSKSTAPTTKTGGEIGQLYVIQSTNKVYVLTSRSGSTYTWSILN